MGTWYKVYADGWCIDIIHADSPQEAIQIAKFRHGEGAVWTYSHY